MRLQRPLLTLLTMSLHWSLFLWSVIKASREGIPKTNRASNTLHCAYMYFESLQLFVGKWRSQVHTLSYTLRLSHLKWFKSHFCFLNVSVRPASLKYWQIQGVRWWQTCVWPEITASLCIKGYPLWLFNVDLCLFGFVLHSSLCDKVSELSRLIRSSLPACLQLY